MSGMMAQTLPWVMVGLLVVCALVLLRGPIRFFAKFLARAAVSLCALACLSPLGGMVGITLGVNLANALVIALLGAPGFGLLLMLNWALA